MLAGALLLAGCAAPGTLVLKEQGSFFVGGREVRAAGDYQPGTGLADTGQSFWVDHLYVQHQVPVNASGIPVVLVHGGGQTGQSWESTPDGREGFQTLLLRRGHPVYIVDLPGRGRAGMLAASGPMGRIGGQAIGPEQSLRVGDRFAWTLFRLGPKHGEFFPNTAFPKQAVEAFLKQSIAWPDEKHDMLSDALAALFERIGPAVLVTHSRAGYTGWAAAMKTDNVRAIVSYEPVEFAFPEKLPQGVARSYPVPRAQFAKLARLPIQVVYGDNLPDKPTPDRGLVVWYVAPKWASSFVEAVNAAGGKAELRRLNDAGLRGNTHFPMSDLNNEAVLGDLLAFLARHGVAAGR